MSPHESRAAESARTTKAAPPRRTRIDVPAERREPLVALLNARLADTLDLYSQTKQAHWNVRGMNFWQLHLLFDALAETVEEHVDLLAERATALGGVAEGTVRAAASASTHPEFPRDLAEDVDYVRAVADRYAAQAAAVRKAIDEADDLGDKTTADLFTEISRGTDKALYFLEAHLR